MDAPLRWLTPVPNSRWEFATCFGFDKQFLDGRRVFRWTLIPYLLARYACAVGFLLYFYTVNIFSPVNNCTPSEGMVASDLSLLSPRITGGYSLGLRGIERMKVLYGWQRQARLFTIQGAYAPQLLACGAKNSGVTRLYMLVSLALHIACLALVLFILLRSHGAELWSLLLSQGLVYFMVSVVVHGSNTVLLLLNLNDGMNLVITKANIGTLSAPQPVAVCFVGVVSTVTRVSQRKGAQAFRAGDATRHLNFPAPVSTVIGYIRRSRLADAALFVSNIFMGIYLWEFVVGFLFDWDVFTRRRAFRWTLVPYFLTRYLSLLGVLGLAVPGNMFSPIGDCKTWWQVLQAMASISLMASSALLIIRVSAVAEFNPWIICFLGLLWIAEAAAVAYGRRRIRAVTACLRAEQLGEQ
ncbi:hypothetical protein AURDEDRAFT_129427 [Auricularia subglabra TFB-10046 SS5]|uniref:Uncharacterized protein n=1 Tax=Auricularia subglabra (strain TFB-10046 / SS5) TaxID=717982 RepID=J0WUH6_AURST|nr:hypothetical protein AURDEDRAFT_129427 [Auricularia subglabra TFB-10046 SS5]